MDKIDWLNVLFHADFSDDQEALSKIPEGVLSDENASLVAASLSHNDTSEHRSEWNTNPGQDYSVAGAVVDVNGANSTEYPTNSTRNTALGLIFPEGSSVPGEGMRIYLTYNVPAAPSGESSEPAAADASTQEGDATPTA